jgi:site-specific DNA-methyltransferase (adenine-specific)
MSKILIIHGDCMSAMKEMPDKAFELAIVDPPYENNDAIGISNGNGHAATRKDYHLFKNTMPPPEYFLELKRVSKNQIVWGGNYFGLRGGAIVWNKEGTAFGEGEIAICSTHHSVRFFRYVWNGMIQHDMKHKEFRIHPTQKPVALYQWLLKNYAKPGDKILDTHGGSCSSAIACDIMGFDADIYEIDADYHKAAVERFERHKQQTVLEFG